ncbi:O-antigen ligase family protein [Candidatus Roizmanbacteria bacterium]|nr:O-antigen ligase family protein [Candidatus Roizmanbacteria bacterium]
MLKSSYVLPFVSFVFILTGIGLSIVSNIVFAQSLFMIVFGIAWLYMLKFRSKITQIPRQLGLLFLLCLIGSILLIFFSADRANSIITLLLSISYALIFFSVQQVDKTQLAKSIVRFLHIVAIGFTAIWVVRLLLGSSIPLWLTSQEVMNFAQIRNGHNSLGHITSLLAVYWYIRMIKKYSKKNFMLFLLWTGITIATFSRTAYLAVMAAILLHLLLERKRFSRTWRNWIFPLGIALSTLTVLFFATTLESKNIPVIGNFHSMLIDQTGLPRKTFFAGRITYIQQSLRALQERPLTGFGGGNFMFVSAKYTDQYNSETASSHNLIFDMLAEYGLVVGILFITLFFFLAATIIRSRNESVAGPYSKPFFYLFTVLIINSCFDLVFTTPHYAFMAIVISGILYHAKKVHTVPSVIPNTVAFLIVMASVWILIPQIGVTLIRNKHIPHWPLPFPLQSEAHISLINHSVRKGLYKDQINQIRFFELLHPENPSALLSLSYVQTERYKFSEANALYNQFLELDSLPTVFAVETVYNFKKEHVGKEEARNVLVNYVEKMKKQKGLWYILSQDEKKTLLALCKETEIPCPAEIY